MTFWNSLHPVYASGPGFASHEHYALVAVRYGGPRWSYGDWQLYTGSGPTLVFNRCRSLGWIHMLPNCWDARSPKSYSLTAAGREALEAFDVVIALHKLGPA